MTALRASALLLLGAAARSLAQAPPPPSPTLYLQPTDAKVQYFGRVDHTVPLEPRFAWVMTGVGASFQAPMPGATLYGNFTAPKDGARLRVMVNGKLSSIIKLGKKSGMTQYALARNLAVGSHTVEVLKVTEDNTNNNRRRLEGSGGNKKEKGTMSFGGFALTGFAAFAPPPPPLARKLEFIGDSDTAGWCADGSAQTGDSPDKYQDAYQTWAQQIARNVSAATTVEAVSGYGVMSRTPAIQPVMDYTLGFDTATRWDYHSWVPDAVVILIGPNDEVVLDSDTASAKFIQAYLQMLDQISTNYHGVPKPPKIIHVCGGSLNGLDPCADIQKANDQYNALGKPMRGFYTTIDVDHWQTINGCRSGNRHCNGKSQYNGCDGHYNVDGHAVLAGDILPQLRQIMSW